MRKRIAVYFSAAACAGALWAVPSRATDCSGVLSTCIDDEALWPHAGPARFIAVGSTETVAPSRLGFGLVADYLSRPIVISVPSSSAHQTANENAINDQVNATFLWSYGVTRRLELDLAFPLTLGQGGTGLAPVTAGAGLKDTAVRDIRFGFAYALLPGAPLRAPSMGDEAPLPLAGSWGLVARLEVSAPTGDRGQFAGERAGVFGPSLAGSYTLGRFFAGVEVGARVRPPAELLGARIGSQAVAALGAGYTILPHDALSAEVEAWALPTFTEQHTVTTSTGRYTSTPNGNRIVPSEWHLSLRTVPARYSDLSIEVGGGGGLPLSGDLPVTTPRFRFVLSLRWTPRSADLDSGPRSQ